MKLEKLSNDDVIRENTEIGDVRYNVFASSEAIAMNYMTVGKVSPDMCRLDCYDDKNKEYVTVYTKISEHDSIDKCIDWALPIMIEDINRTNNE